MPELIINFSSPQPAAARLLLTEMGRPASGLTQVEAAQLANAAHGQGLCGEAATEEQGPITAAELMARLTDGAAPLAEKLACVPAAGNQWQTKIKVTCFPVGLAYTLLAPGCQVSPAARETIAGGETMQINGESGVASPVPTHALTGAAWSGPVFDTSGRQLLIPEITLSGDRLTWGGPVVGTLVISWLEDALVHTITLSADSALVIAFYSTGAESLTIRRPAMAEDDICPTQELRTELADPCLEATQYLHHCSCGGGRRPDLDYESREEVECAGPDHSILWRTVDVYVSCSSEEKDDPFFDPAYYEEICCRPPGNPPYIPSCKKKITPFLGEDPPTGYPEGTVFVPVNIPAGPCGTHTEEWVVQQKDCCEEVAPLAWDSDTSAETMGRNAAVLVAVTGGKAPITWTVAGQGVWLNSSHTRKTIQDGNTVVVYTDDTACGAFLVTARDVCRQEATGTLRCEVGVWERIEYKDCYGSCPTTAYSGTGQTHEIYEQNLRHTLLLTIDCLCSTFDPAALSCWPALFAEGDGVSCVWWGNSWSKDCCEGAACRVCAVRRSTYKWICP